MEDLDISEIIWKLGQFSCSGNRLSWLQKIKRQPDSVNVTCLSCNYSGLVSLNRNNAQWLVNYLESYHEKQALSIVAVSHFFLMQRATPAPQTCTSRWLCVRKPQWVLCIMWQKDYNYISSDVVTQQTKILLSYADVARFAKLFNWIFKLWSI